MNFLLLPAGARNQSFLFLKSSFHLKRRPSQTLSRTKRSRCILGRTPGKTADGGRPRYKYLSIFIPRSRLVSIFVTINARIRQFFSDDQRRIPRFRIYRTRQSLYRNCFHRKAKTEKVESPADRCHHVREI